jgi:hypothetical protein
VEPQFPEISPRQIEQQRSAIEAQLAGAGKRQVKDHISVYGLYGRMF